MKPPSPPRGKGRRKEAIAIIIPMVSAIKNVLTVEKVAVLLILAIGSLCGAF
jgi:hypothetical protein